MTTVDLKIISAEVAEKVMGLTLCAERHVIWTISGVLNYYDCPHHDQSHFGPDDLPEYPTKIQDAWSVVEKMASNGYSYSIYGVPTHSSVINGVCVQFKKGIHPAFFGQASDGDAVEETAQLAICVAALRAVSLAYDNV